MWLSTANGMGSKWCLSHSGLAHKILPCPSFSLVPSAGWTSMSTVTMILHLCACMSKATYWRWQSCHQPGSLHHCVEQSQLPSSFCLWLDFVGEGNKGSVLVTATNNTLIIQHLIVIWPISSRTVCVFLSPLELQKARLSCIAILISTSKNPCSFLLLLILSLQQN
jgi:hypothetical protein